MNDKVTAFLAAARAQPDLANKIQAIYGDAAATVAARLSELSQDTPFAFGPEEILNHGGLSDDQLDGVSGGAGVSKVDYHDEYTGSGPKTAPGGPFDIFGAINNFKFR